MLEWLILMNGARLALEVLVENDGVRPRRGAEHGARKADHLRVGLLGGEAIDGQHAAVVGERRLGPAAVELSGAGGMAWEAPSLRASTPSLYGAVGEMLAAGRSRPPFYGEVW